MPKKKIKSPKPEDFLTFVIMLPHHYPNVLEAFNAFSKEKDVKGSFVDLQCFKKQFVKDKNFRNKQMRRMGEALVAEINKFEKAQRKNKKLCSGQS